MVFEFSNEWVIIDIEELHKYIEINKGKEFNLNDLLKKLEWNITLPK